MLKLLKKIKRRIGALLGKPDAPKVLSPEDYYRSKGVLIGKNVSLIEPINFGSEPYLISIGDNTTVSFDVAFVTHDAATRVLRNLPGGNRDTGFYGEIVIGKNSFIGCRSTILPNVHIGDSTIIGAGSLVTRDIPSNVVAVGNPCRVICTLDEYIKKNRESFFYIQSLGQDDKRRYLMDYFKRKDMNEV